MGFTGGSVQQHGNRYYVQLYWAGQTEKFWSVLIQGQWHPIKSPENGDKLLGAIREAIDRDRVGFDSRAPALDFITFFPTQFCKYLILYVPIPYH